MSRKRKSRILFWPTLVAAAVTLVMLGGPQLRLFVGLESVDDSAAEHISNGASARQATWSRLPFAKSLNASGKIPGPSPTQSDLSGFAPDSGTPAPHTFGNTPIPSYVEPADVLPAPAGEPAAVARLQAPVRDTREELAGLEFDKTLEIAGNRGFSGPSNGRLASFATAAQGDSQSTLATTDVGHSDERSPQRQSFAPQTSDGAGARIQFSDSRYGADAYDIDKAATTSSQLDRRSTLTDDTSDQPSPRQPLQDKPLGLAWPRTPSLDTALAQLAEFAPLAPWCEDVRTNLLSLQAITSLHDPTATAWIDQLHELAEQGLRFGETLAHDRLRQEQVLRTAHALLRRTVVWGAICRVNHRDNESLQLVSMRIRNPAGLQGTIESLRQRTQATGDPAGWQDYLLLDELTHLDRYPAAEQRRLLAQRLLSRVEWDGLTEAQAAWLGDDSVQQLVSEIRPWTESPIDYVNLLQGLEQLESDALDDISDQLASAVQTLRFSAHPSAQAVAHAVNDYYRNANIRVAVSADLIARLLPEIPPRTTPIRQTIVGIPVRGTGVVNSQLDFQLIPTEGAWNLQLSTLGSIRGTTGSNQWPVRIANRSFSEFNAVTPIRINRHGVVVDDTNAVVNSQVRLRGMTTEFDGFPIVESLVRSIATAQYRERSGLARRQSEQLVKREIESTVSDEVNTEIDKASAELSHRLLGPLGRLQLDPLVVDLTTTESRLLARYRVAGDWQMAAFTPRPRALSNSVLSVQVHQSMLNNTFEQLAPAGHPQPLPNIYGEILQMFGVENHELPDDVPNDVQVQFARTRPVTVEIEDGQLWLTLRIVRITNDSGLDFDHFMVRANYQPVMDGMRTRLERVGSLQIEGRRMPLRERISVRAIFNKVLHKNRHLPLVASNLADHPAGANLTVGMLELTDGWLCMAICPTSTESTTEVSDRLAEQPQSDKPASSHK